MRLANHRAGMLDEGGEELSFYDAVNDGEGEGIAINQEENSRVVEVKPIDKATKESSDHEDGLITRKFDNVTDTAANQVILDENEGNDDTLNSANRAGFSELSEETTDSIIGEEILDEGEPDEEKPMEPINEGEKGIESIPVLGQSFEEQRAQKPQYFIPYVNDQPQDSNEQANSMFPSWGGMFSALNSIKEKANLHLDKLYDALDPNLPNEGEEQVSPSMKEDKSIKNLLEKISPESPRGSWMDEFDKTFDFASDKIGQVLLGGLKKLETTVGMSIEPVSSANNSDDDEAELEGGKVEHSQSRDEDRTLDVKPSTRERVGDLGKNIYSAGLSTLERLGKTTAGIVVSTKDKLTPLLSQNQDAVDGKIDRHELRKSFTELFEEFSGNDILETLQVKSTQAAIQLKKKLKALTPKQLAAVQVELKGVASGLETLQEADLEWSGFQEVILTDQKQFVERLHHTISSSLEGISNNPEQNIEDLRRRVESPLPVDTSSLLIYLVRNKLANILSAAIHILACINYSMEMKDQIMLRIEGLYGTVSKVQSLINTTLIDANRQTAIIKLISDDCASARSIYKDAVLTLQPFFKLSRYNSLYGLNADGN